MNADGIRELIAQRGAVTFRDFMELALYHPEHGYYGAGRAVLGRAGDYFTSVSVGPIYGELMAAQFQEMWEKLGQPEGFTIVEQGANDGAFAADVLGGVPEGGAGFLCDAPVRARGTGARIAREAEGAAGGI